MVNITSLLGCPPACTVYGDKHLVLKLQQDTAGSTGHKEAKERELRAQNVGWSMPINPYFFLFPM